VKLGSITSLLRVTRSEPRNYWIHLGKRTRSSLISSYSKSTSKCPTARHISSIHYTVPDKDPFEDLEINTHIQDSRLLPVTEAGDTISRDFLKQYLEERLKEYLALGGLKELLDRKSLLQAGHKLPAPFYWYLWGNLDHLREAYQEWLAEHLFEVPESDEGDVDSDSDISWDTQ
jgi:hypothetical protein